MAQRLALDDVKLCVLHQDEGFAGIGITGDIQFILTLDFSDDHETREFIALGFFEDFVRVKAIRIANLLRDKHVNIGVI